MLRRNLLKAAVAAATGHSILTKSSVVRRREHHRRGHQFGVIPVVADGKWIWKQPPAETGYLEPRSFRFKAAIQLQGRGPAGQIRATTVVPVTLPEQTIDDMWIEKQGCNARLRRVGATAAQLVLAAPSIRPGQVISAIAHFEITLRKTHPGFQVDQFPPTQEFDKAFRKQFLYDSPGIQTRHESVRELAREVGEAHRHPWHKAIAFKNWVWNNIDHQEGYYTSVVEALRERVGDCEEKATVFSALCRACGIPTRLVWVPGHCWAEFCLRDHDGKRHWIPAHTSGYEWFGFTGAHELVMQKGDKIVVPEKRKPLRLLADWMQWRGARPHVAYPAELRPSASSSDNTAGPGTRIKDGQGIWGVPEKELKEYFDYDDSKPQYGTGIRVLK